MFLLFFFWIKKITTQNYIGTYSMSDERSPTCSQCVRLRAHISTVKRKIVATSDVLSLLSASQERVKALERELASGKSW